jgi:hypothetical protein
MPPEFSNLFPKQVIIPGSWLIKFGLVALGWRLPAKSTAGAMMGQESGAEIYLSVVIACRLLLELLSRLFLHVCVGYIEQKK